MNRRQALGALAGGALPFIGMARSSAAAAPAVFDVTSYGARGDGSDDTLPISNAIAAAKTSGGGRIYFPRGVYAAAVEVRDTSGIELFGDGPRVTAIRGLRSTGAVAVNVVSDLYSGGVGDISIRDMAISYDGSSYDTTALRIWNAIGVTISNVSVWSNGTAISVQGSGKIMAASSNFYLGQTPPAARAACLIGAGGGTLTSPGPMTFWGCQFAGAYTPAMRISDSGVTAANFANCFFQAAGPGIPGAVMVDGKWTSAVFDSCYGESLFNSSANDLAVYVVGSISKPSSVTVRGGSYWGHGDGAHYCQDFLRNHSARALRVEGVSVSRLTAPYGFTRSFVRFEAGALQPGDSVVCLNNDKDNINGSMYSDALSRIDATATNGLMWGGVKIY